MSIGINDAALLRESLKSSNRISGALVSLCAIKRQEVVTTCRETLLMIKVCENGSETYSELGDDLELRKMPEKPDKNQLCWHF